jgi:hypothetical protein
MKLTAPATTLGRLLGHEFIVRGEMETAIVRRVCNDGLDLPKLADIEARVTHVPTARW